MDGLKLSWISIPAFLSLSLSLSYPSGPERCPVRMLRNDLQKARTLKENLMEEKGSREYWKNVCVEQILFDLGMNVIYYLSMYLGGVGLDSRPWILRQMSLVMQAGWAHFSSCAGRKVGWNLN